VKRLASYILMGVVGAVFLLGVHCAAGAMENGDDADVKPSFHPQMIFVSNFSIDVQAREKGDKHRLHLRERIEEMVDPSEESPEDKAKAIVNTVAESIVAELNSKNVKAVHISGQGEPSSGSWLLEGEFVEYGEGDNLKKAIIGFGSGSASMEVRVRLSEVMDGGMRPLYDSTLSGKKNRMPGAFVTKNPYVAGAKYVLAKAASGMEVKKLGSQIADKLLEYMKSQGF